MNLQNLSIQELVETEGGFTDALITGGNGNYYDDGSGKGCIPMPDFLKPI